MDKAYRKRKINQLERWIKGEPIHDHKSGECVPDFSCCNKNVNTDKSEKIIFLNAFKRNDDATVNFLLMGFLSKALSTLTEKEIYVASGEDPINN